MKINELVRLVNEEGKDIYVLSEGEGFSKGTLRQRLLKEGYKQDRMGMWKYEGESDKEPLNMVITYPSKRKQGFKAANYNPEKPIKSEDLFTALLQLQLNGEAFTDSFKTDKALAERMKTFIRQVSLPVGKIYSLAIYEFLEKYEPLIDNMKNKERRS